MLNLAQIPRKWPGWGWLGWGIGVFLAHAALFWLSHHPEPRVLVGDEAMYWTGAQTLAAGETWYFQSLWPPFQAVVLAGILALGGSLFTVQVIQTLMLVAVALLVADLTRALSRSAVAGAVAGGLVLLYPPLVSFAHFLWPEILHLLLWVGALWILVRRRHSLPWAAAAGVLLGLALVSKYLLWPLAPLVVGLALGRSPRESGARAVLLALGMAAVLVPVASWDRLQVDGTPILDSATFNLWVGLNDRSRRNFVDPVVPQIYREYRASAPSAEERSAILREKIAARVAERGGGSILAEQLGRQYFRLLDHHSFLTDQLPGGAIAARGFGYRGAPPWLSAALRLLSTALYLGILVGTVVGIAVVWSEHRRWLWVVLVFLAYNLGLFLLVHVKTRYRIQLLPFGFGFSGCAVAWLTARLGWNPDEVALWQRQLSRSGWAGVVFVVAGLLGLALGGSWID